MAARGLAMILGLIGGLLVSIGGLVSLLSASVRSLSGSTTGFLSGPVVSFLVAFVLGLLILWASRPRWWWWPGRRLFNGVLLVVLGVLAWVFAGGSVLTVIGALLTIVAGVVLPLEGFVGAVFGRGRLFRRRLFRRGFW